MKDFGCGFSNLKILVAVHLAMAPTGTKVLDSSAINWAGVKTRDRKG